MSGIAHPSTFEPEQDDGFVCIVEGVPLRLQVVDGGLQYVRPGVSRPVRVLLPDGRHPSLVIRPFAASVLVQFPTPIVIAASSKRRLWMPWPLEIGVVSDDGAELDVFRPRFRRTLFGTVTDGTVVPVAMGMPVAGPDATEFAGRPVAALDLRVHNTSNQPVTFPRFPVHGAQLPLFRKGDSLASARVEVSLLDAGMAEAFSHAGAAPEGFETAIAAEGRGGSRSRWRLASTTASSESPD